MQNDFAATFLDIPGLDIPGINSVGYPLGYSRYRLQRYAYGSARNRCEVLLSRLFVCHYVDVPTVRADIEYLRDSCPDRPFVLIANRVHADTIRWATGLRIHNLFAVPQELPSVHRLLDRWCGSGDCAQDSPARCTDNCAPACAAKWRTFSALAYVHRHYDSRVCVNDVAKLCSMSVSTFYRAFKAEQNMSFSDYLMCLRVHVAKLLLRHTALPVSEVGVSVGFCDGSHFGKAFRALERVTPSDYRLSISSLKF